MKCVVISFACDVDIHTHKALTKTTTTTTTTLRGHFGSRLPTHKSRSVFNSANNVSEIWLGYVSFFFGGVFAGCDLRVCCGDCAACCGELGLCCDGRRVYAGRVAYCREFFAMVLVVLP